jgi:hypothetical protein
MEPSQPAMADERQPPTVDERDGLAPHGHRVPHTRRRLPRFYGSMPGRTDSFWIAIATGLLAVGICGYQLAQPHILKGVHGFRSGIGYDDGVYLGAAIRLIHGALPYSDFVYVHPPGAPLLFAPVAAVGEVIGTQNALALARCLTALVVGVNAALAALAVRNRGPVAMLVAGVALACFPLAVAADHTLLLEPYIVLFCLLGITAMMSHGALASPRRLLVAGLLFGFAGDIKVWAIFPAIAALCCCLPEWRWALRPFCIGLVAGFGVPAVPFFLLAPHAFISDVLVAQFGRATSEIAPLSAGKRLVAMSGVAGLSGGAVKTTTVVALAVAGAVLVAVLYASTARRCSRAEWFILLAAVCVVGGMFIPGEFYDHYAYFPAAFLAMIAGVCAGRANDALAYATKGVDGTRGRILGLAAPLLVPSLVLALASLSIPPTARSARVYLAAAEEPGPVLGGTIPTGACVISDDPVLLITADRIVAKSNDCPAVVDPFGMWLTDDDGALPHFSDSLPAAFVGRWRTWLERADYVVLSVRQSSYIPWSVDLLAWFNINYQLVSEQPHAYVYRRVVLTPAASAQALVQRGLSEQQQGQNDAARADYLAALALDPKNKYAYYNLGVISQQQGDPGAAETQYNLALLIDGNFRPALFNLAVLKTRSAPVEAVALYRKIIANNPDDANANLNIGLLLLKMGDTMRGQQYLATAVRLDPSLASRVPKPTKTR